MIKGEKKNRVAEQIPPPGFKLSKNDMAKKAVCLTIHQFVKTGDLCGGFYTERGLVERIFAPAGVSGTF